MAARRRKSGSKSKRRGGASRTRTYKSKTGVWKLEKISSYVSPRRGKKGKGKKRATKRKARKSSKRRAPAKGRKRTASKGRKRTSRARKSRKSSRGRKTSKRRRPAGLLSKLGAKRRSVKRGAKGRVRNLKKLPPLTVKSITLHGSNLLHHAAKAVAPVAHAVKGRARGKNGRFTKRTAMWEA